MSETGVNRKTHFVGLPRRATVVPRASWWPDGEILPLEYLVQQLLDRPERALIHFWGPPGSGKTTALAHLAATIDHERLHLYDLSAPYGEPERRDAVTIAAAPDALSGQGWLFLAPWTEEDIIEYLLAVHRQKCKSVMARIRGNSIELGGSPELWTRVLDCLASDESLPHPTAALLRMIDNATAPRNLNENASRALSQMNHIAMLDLSDLPAPLQALARHPYARRLMSAKRLAAEIDSGNLTNLGARLPAELLPETGRLLTASAVEQLEKHFAADPEIQPVVAALLLAHNAAWRPATQPKDLEKAQLAGVRWEAIDLTECNLFSANLARADLTRAKLHAVTAPYSKFSGTILHEANLNHLYAQGADFTRAQLVRAFGEVVRFADCDLSFADLSDVKLPQANFDQARLEGTRFCGANLSRATFKAVNARNADFTGSLLNHTRWSRATFTGATLRDVDLSHAALAVCDLEFLDMEGVDLTNASLGRSYLTATTLRNCTLEHASLRNAGLADVDWEGCSLAGADLSGASFHMGSSRSGLVESTIASEGTRTGFYTDDYNAQDYKPPEEIRKANLSRCDLRGAIVESCDFYLVDLRGAHYTKDQARHFARCGAILRDRV